MPTPIIDALTHISTGPDDVIGWGPCWTGRRPASPYGHTAQGLWHAGPVDKAVVFPSLGLTVPTSTLIV